LGHFRRLRLVFLDDFQRDWRKRLDFLCVSGLSLSQCTPVLITPTADVSGTFEGSLARDTVSVGGLSITNQDLAVMPSSSLASSSPFSGIIGLAFPSISRFGKPTFLQNLVSAGKLKNGLFSFYFSRNGTSGSELTLGGVDDKKHDGGFLRVPVVSETHVRLHLILSISSSCSDFAFSLQWTIQTSEVLVDRKRTKKVAVATAIDTGSSVVRPPSPYFPRASSSFLSTRSPTCPKPPSIPVRLLYSPLEPST
jgi:hypothetical protein